MEEAENPQKSKHFQKIRNMKKISFLKKSLLVFCLVMGIKNLQAQCTVNIYYSVGANGVVSFTGVASPVNASTYYYWYLPGSTTPVGPQGTNAWNATATYTANGIYSVTFGISSTAPTCSVNTTQTISVNTLTVNPNPCVLNVQYTPPSPSQCNGSATVTAPGNMCGAISYTWSTLATGSTINGLCAGNSYSVMASSVSGVNCCSVALGVVNIPTVNPCGLNANFYWAQSANGLVTFNNSSTGTTGGTTYSWNFGDGGSSTSASPVHTYSANGSYTVTLTANNNSNPACSDSQTYIVYVYTYCNIVAGFSYSQNANNVSFTNSSTGASTYYWNFGDGNVGGGPNPSHTYTATGTYTVVLSAIGASINPCADSTWQVVTVSTVNPPCVANAGFSLSPTGTPQYWNAFPLYPANVTYATWYWGDGSSSNTLYTSHTYSTAGTYTICLSVNVNCGASDISCYTYAIFRSSQDQNIITVNVINPATVGIKNAEAENVLYSISPNPNSGSFNMNASGLPAGPVKMTIYNIVGAQVYSTEINGNNGSLSKDIQLNEAPNGVYFIHLNADNKTFTKKVIINR